MDQKFDPLNVQITYHNLKISDRIELSYKPKNVIMEELNEDQTPAKPPHNS
jgi:hypothetical protein